MPLQPGQNLLHYRLGDKIGEGGMGEVYRARDGKLGRDVALKFLPDAFAADTDRMARFTREAQVLASLNHPNIAGIYSVEEVPADQAGTGPSPRFLVMELVEGETLQERIARGPLPLDEALQITLHIATGLEEAHERGIIHRDLKPANVKLTTGRQAKILDFGLAKAFDSEPGADPGSSGGSGSRMSLSPTMTAGASQAGMLLGTAAYMSPEQARGEPADRRADIWALGVVLMEMLTGKSVHRGNTISDTLASVLAREPAWDDLPADTPGPVRRLLERCLEKDSRQRLRDVGEARIAIERFMAAPEEEGEAGAVVAASPWKRTLPWAMAAVLAVSTLFTLLALFSRTPAPGTPVRASLIVPGEAGLFTGFGASAVLSPDGSRMAFITGPGNKTELHVRALDQWEGTLLSQGDGSARPYQPFFSPDGQWIGFVTPTQLRKVPVNGGTPIKLCDVQRARGATWGPQGTIVFAPGPASPLMQVADAGGQPQPLTELDTEKGERTHRWPQWLPGGRALIFTSHTKLSDFEQASIELFVPETGERRVLHQGGTFGRYVSTNDDSGYLIYANAGSLFGVPFDLDQLQIAGSAAPVIERVTSGEVEGSVQFSTSSDGKLAYASGAALAAGHSVVWVDRDGQVEPLSEEEKYYRNPAFSPDGTRLAMDIATEGQSDIWIHDIDRGVSSRLTFSEDDEGGPIWSPDGQYIYYSASDADGQSRIQRKPADGSGEPETVYDPDVDVFAHSISADGKLLAITQSVDEQNQDVGVLRLDEETEPRMLVTTPFVDLLAQLSPNGRWLAYVSNESGDMEVYVRSVTGRGKWQISAGGGFWPLWSHDGKELFFTQGNSLFGTEVDTEAPTFRPGRARAVAEGTILDVGFGYPFGVFPDGQRFVAFRMEAAAADDSHQHVELVLNWRAELQATFAK